MEFYSTGSKCFFGLCLHCGSYMFCVLYNILSMQWCDVEWKSKFTMSCVQIFVHSISISILFINNMLYTYLHYIILYIIVIIHEITFLSSLVWLFDVLSHMFLYFIIIILLLLDILIHKEQIFLGADTFLGSILNIFNTQYVSVM